MEYPTNEEMEARFLNLIGPAIPSVRPPGMNDPEYARYLYENGGVTTSDLNPGFAPPSAPAPFDPLTDYVGPGTQVSRDQKNIGKPDQFPANNGTGKSLFETVTGFGLLDVAFMALGLFIVLLALARPLLQSTPAGRALTIARAARAA